MEENTRWIHNELLTGLFLSCGIKAHFYFFSFVCNLFEKRCSFGGAINFILCPLHSFIHLLKIFNEHLCARPCAKHFIYN